MRLHVDEHSPIPMRRQLTEQLKHVIEGGGVPRDPALPSIRELAGFLGINPNTVARAIEESQAERMPAAPPAVRRRLSPRPSGGRPPRQGATRQTATGT